MTTIRTLVGRIAEYMQDSDNIGWSYAEKRARLMDALSQLARQEAFGNIAWRQGVSGQAQYTFDDTLVTFADVLYDGRSLLPVSEQSLSTYHRTWEQRSQHPPQVWTSELQSPQTVRLVPTPLANGSGVPTSPSVPLPESEVLNVIAFVWEQPQDLLVGDDTDVAVPVLVEDVIVWMAVAALTGQQQEYNDPQKAACFAHLAQLEIDALLVDM